jgi:hypothetical protein
MLSDPVNWVNGLLFMRFTGKGSIVYLVLAGWQQYTNAKQLNSHCCEQKLAFSDHYLETSTNTYACT